MTVQTSRSPGAAIRLAAAAQPAAAPRQAWLMVALLFLFMVINFADKAVVGIAAVPIMDELGLGPREFGLLGSSFFLLFALSAIVTGINWHHSVLPIVALVFFLFAALAKGLADAERRRVD